MLSPIETDSLECHRDKILQFPGLARGDDEIVGSLLLKHQKHCLHVFRSPAPVALNVDVAQLKFLLPALRDSASRLGDLLCNKSFGAQWRLVIEQNSGTSKDTVGFSVIGHLPESRSLGDSIGASRPERGLLGGCFAALISETFAGTRVVELDPFSGEPDRLQEIECAKVDAFLGFHR
jgi:hypothetical protein